MRRSARSTRPIPLDDHPPPHALPAIAPAHDPPAARELVRRKLRTLTRVDDQTATRRLVGMLARKGYASGLAFSVVRDELASSGREEPEEPHSV